MNKHFMIDIEATGIDPKHEDLLQVGILETDFVDGFWTIGRAKEWTLFSDLKPKSAFAREHMQELFGKCNTAPPLDFKRLRWEILEFLRSCGTTGVEDTFFMGWNCSNFDLPFLVAKGILTPSSYETVIEDDGKAVDKMVGDFHYRIYEMGGAVSHAMNVARENDREDFMKRVREELKTMPKPPFGGKKHEALYDCYQQLSLLNILIKIARSSY